MPPLAGLVPHSCNGWHRLEGLVLGSRRSGPLNAVMTVIEELH
jgi:hypothetical protein